jgi:hypothetical protein|tara:strand:+ start:954 stop:2099 length:1146 start_codon:yes stop_codon:yes gene_type:complete
MKATQVRTYKDRLRDGVPMSENLSKLQKGWGPEDCIGELKRLANENESKVLTRNYVRVNSVMSESTWNRYFGTFEEFKRQAGVKLTKQQHARETSIAKHASVDHYRNLNDRHNWGDDYSKDSKSNEKVILVGSDFHDNHVDKFFLRVFLDVAKRLNPSDICLAGDIFDLPEWGSYAVDPRNWDPAGRVRFVHSSVLKPLRESCPDSNIDMLEGNHEYRLVREGVDATKALINGLHGMGTREILGLDKFEINYIAKANAATFTSANIKKELRKNWKVYYETALIHHFPIGKRMGMPGCHGHHHKHLVWPGFSPQYGPYEWHQIGAGHERTATYTNADDMWQNGFLIMYLNTKSKSVNFEYIQVTDFAIAGGKKYRRTASEIY